MSSIIADDLISILEDHKNYEVVMNIKHNYPISKESGQKGWIAYINGVEINEERKEIRLMN